MKRHCLAMIAAVVSGACASPLSVTPGELAMTSNPLLAGGDALVLERSATLVLGYQEGEDAFGSKQHVMEALNSGAVDLNEVNNAARVMRLAREESYTLTVVQRIKFFAQPEGQYHRFTVQLPARATLQDFEAKSFMPDGKVVELAEGQVTLDEGILRFSQPVVEGAVVAYRYSVHGEDLTGLKGWRFQSSMPTLTSRLRVKVNTRSSILFQFLTEDPKLAPKLERRTIAGSARPQGSWLTWTLTDLPAVAANDVPAVMLIQQ